MYCHFLFILAKLVGDGGGGWGWVGGGVGGVGGYISFQEKSSRKKKIINLNDIMIMMNSVTK